MLAGRGDPLDDLGPLGDQPGELRLEPVRAPRATAGPARRRPCAASPGRRRRPPRRSCPAPRPGAGPATALRLVAGAVGLGGRQLDDPGDGRRLGRLDLGQQRVGDARSALRRPDGVRSTAHGIGRPTRRAARLARRPGTPGRERVDQRVLVLLGGVGRGPPHAQVGARGGGSGARTRSRPASGRRARSSRSTTARPATEPGRRARRAARAATAARTRRAAGLQVLRHRPGAVEAGGPARAPATCRRARGPGRAWGWGPASSTTNTPGAAWRAGRPHGTGPSAMRPTSRIRSRRCGRRASGPIRAEGGRARGLACGRADVIVSPSCRTSLLESRPRLAPAARAPGAPHRPARRRLAVAAGGGSQARGRRRHRRGPGRPDARRRPACSRRPTAARTSPPSPVRPTRPPTPPRPTPRRRARQARPTPQPAATEAPPAPTPRHRPRRRPDPGRSSRPSSSRRALDEFRAKLEHPRHLGRDPVGRRPGLGRRLRAAGRGPQASR